MASPKRCVGISFVPNVTALNLSRILCCKISCVGRSWAEALQNLNAEISSIKMQELQQLQRLTKSVSRVMPKATIEVYKPPGNVVGYM